MLYMYLQVIKGK